MSVHPTELPRFRRRPRDIMRRNSAACEMDQGRVGGRTGSRFRASDLRTALGREAEVGASLRHSVPSLIRMHAVPRRVVWPRLAYKRCHQMTFRRALWERPTGRLASEGAESSPWRRRRARSWMPLAEVRRGHRSVPSCEPARCHGQRSRCTQRAHEPSGMYSSGRR